MISLLYVDDEPGLLELGKLFLENTGEFEVTTAGSGDEALGQLAQHDFDAIVSDFQMPVMDGIALLKEVRKSCGPIPFVLFTGRGREEVVIDAINNGVDFYLQKGGDPKAQFAELSHKVRQAVTRRRAEIALSDSEQRLADIINFLPDATFAIDTRGVVIAWNRAMERMTSFSSENVLGKGDYEYALPFYHERRPLLINLVLDDDPAIGEKYPFVKKEGRTLFSEITIPHFNDGRGAALWFTASPLYNRNGEVVGAIESIREITERKRAEESLVSANREYTNLLDQIQDVYYRSDAEGRLVRASRSWATLFGYGDVSECIGRNIADDFYFNPSDRKPLVEEIFRNGKITGREILLKKRDGTSVLVEASSHLWFDPAGNIAGIEGTFRDITDRKKSEEELRAANEQLVASDEELQAQYNELAASEDRIRQSEQKYRTVFETTGTAMLMIEDDATISLVNAEFSRLSGYTRNEIENRMKWTEFVAEEDRDRMLAQHRMRRLDRDGALRRYEFRFLTRSGDIRNIYLAIDIVPGTTKSVASLLDITEQKKAGDELLAANEQLAAGAEELQSQYDELVATEARVRMSETRLRYMLGFYEYAQKSEKDLLTYAIEGAGIVTGSPLGYLAFLNNDESELSMYAWSKSAMAECAMREKPIVYKTEKTGLWGEAVRQRRPVITNDYAAPNPAKKGYPEGHPGIIRHMNIPVLDEGHIVLVAGVANKSSDYTDNDVSELTLLMQGLWTILKRKRAEENEKNSLVFLNALIDQSPNSTWIADDKGFLIRMNAACERLLHAGQADLAGKYNILNDNIVEEQGFMPLVRSVFSEGRVVSFTLQYDSARLSGLNLQEPVSIIVEVTIFPVKNSAGTITNAVIIHNDVTERKRAEAKLQATYEQIAATEEELRQQYEELSESERRLREKTEELDQYFSASLDLFCIADTSGNFRRLNPEWEKTLGYPLAELEGKRFLDFVHPDDLQPTIDVIGDLKSQKEVLNFTNRYRHRDGTYRWIEWRSMPKGDMVFAAARDITGRKNAEAALAGSEAKYRNIIDHAPAGMHFYELKPDGSLVFTGANPGADRILGVEHHRFIGKTLEEAFPPLLKTEIPAQYRKVAAEGGTWQTDHIVYDGEAIHGVYAVTAFQISPGAMVAMFTDITTRKKAETDLKAAYEQVSAAEEELREQYDSLAAAQAEISSRRQQLEEIASTVPGVVYQFYSRPDGSRGMYYVSNRTKEIFGIAPDLERFFPAFTACVHPDDRSGFLSSIDDAVKRKTDWHFEGRFTRQSGDTLWFEGISSPVVHGNELVFTGVIRNITDRKRMEETIRESEERYRSLVELYPDAVMVHRGGTVLYANPEALRLVGAKREEEVIGREVLPFIHPDDRPMALEDFRQLYEEGTIIPLKEERLLRIDGDPFTVEVTASPIQYQGMLSVLVVFRDITDRKRAEDELMRLKISTDRSSDEVFWMDFAGNILYVNDAACRITGYSREEFLKMKIFTLDPDFPPEVWDASVADLRERKTQFITTRHRRKDGVVIDVEIVTVYVNQYDREYSFAYVRDVTGRKRTEDALFNSQQMLQLVLDSIPQRVFWKDRNSVYLGCNKPLAKDAGYDDPKELVGKDDFDTDYTATADLYRADDRRVMETGESRINYEEPQIRPDGSRAWLRTTKVPLRDKTGTIIGVLGTYEDITDRKRTEEALRDSEEKYRTLVESSFDGIAIHQDGILVYINRTAARILGTDDPGVFIGKPAIDVVAPAFREWIVHRVKQGPANSQELVQEQFLKIDGTTIDVDVTTTPCAWKGRPAAYVTFRDISQQKRAEQALRESEEKFRALVETTSDFLWEVDTEGRYTYVSPQVRRILGYGPEELLGKTPFEIMPPGDARRISAEFARHIESRLPIAALENTAIRKDGSIVVLETSGVVRTAGDGSYLGYRGIDRDITKRKAAEDALRRSEARLSSILHGSPVLQFVIDRNHRVMFWNNAIEKYSGIRAADIVGTDQQWRAFYADKRPVLADLLIDGNTDAIYRLYSEKLKKSRYVEEAYEATDIFPHMGSSGVWLSFTAAPIRDDQGVIIGAVETLEDVTERVTAENALRESEERTRTILNTAQAGIVLVDAVTHEIIDANKKALELIGLERDSVIGEVCHHFICPAEKGKCPVTDGGQQVDTSERVLITASGETIPVLKTVVPVSLSGRSVLVESFVDIIEQKRSEVAIREANRKLNLLNSITRHDIRNQLMVAQGFTQLAVLSKPDATVLDFLAKITAAIETIQHQIEFTKAYQELGVHAPAWFLVSDVISGVRPEKIALRIPCKGVEIFADPMIDKVFFNLFDNAVKYGERVTTVTVGCEEIDDYLVITFADDGCGIPPAEKKKIFGKGYGKNTGLGLFLAREILAITGITIHENGTYGEGAVFEIIIPKGAYRKQEQACTPA